MVEAMDIAHEGRILSSDWVDWLVLNNAQWVDLICDFNPNINWRSSFPVGLNIKEKPPASSATFHLG
jgi:hypothetical protein